MRRAIAVAFGCLGLLASQVALGAATPEQKCEAAKNKAAGAYASCLQAAQAKAVLKGEAPDFTKCDTRLAKAFTKAESKAAKKGAACPSAGDAALMQSFVNGHSVSVSEALGGGGLPGCGNGEVDVAGEECDLADLRGKECGDFSFLGGSLACDGSCQYDLGGCFHCPGEEVGGFCWILGELNQSCDAVCSAALLSYNDLGTRGFAGSDGTNENCESVLDDLGAPGSGPPAFFDCADGLGCAAATGGERARCLNVATNAAATLGGVMRACACD